MSNILYHVRTRRNFISRMIRRRVYVSRGLLEFWRRLSRDTLGSGDRKRSRECGGVVEKGRPPKYRVYWDWMNFLRFEDIVFMYVFIYGLRV